MFGGIWLKAKTLRVLKDDYGYEPAVPGRQNSTFAATVKFAQTLKANEYDAAAFFMLSQIEMLARSPVLDDKGRAFIRRHCDTTRALMDRMKLREKVTELLGKLEANSAV